MKRICHACQKTLDIGDRVGRREACPFCGRDLHVCLNCRFYAPGAYNDCRETQRCGTGLESIEERFGRLIERKVVLSGKERE